jgi:predicted DNA-binding transcriptional regulator AlpA
MIAKIESMPETDAGDVTAGLLDKRDLARLLKLSPRSISNWMDKGLPHLRLGERRVRFVAPDVMKWFQENCGCQRIGKLNGNQATPAK